MKPINTPAADAAREIARFLRHDGGATSIEYAIIASGVAVAVAATVFQLGTKVNTMFTTLANLFP